MNALEEPADADWVIAGGGTAGCVLAARLSEDPRNTVILLEAGGNGRGVLVDMPAGTFALMGRAGPDWIYPMTPDPSIDGRSNRMSAGRMLGGSGAINGMTYARGQRSDYERWVRSGAAGWGWDELLPYFLRSERFAGPPSAWHGQDGPLSVGLGRARHDLVDPVIATLAALGVPLRTEYCDGDQFGVYEPFTATDRGERCSSASAMLRPAMKRPNLRIVTKAHVDRVVVEEGKAVGFRYLRRGRFHEVRGREMILSAGTIGSPAVLLRSGIGPAETLRNCGIRVHADLPVGKNLQDHVSIMISKLVSVPTYNSPSGLLTNGRNFARWLLTRTGPMASCPVHVLAGIKTDPQLYEPDALINFMPFAIDIRGRRPRMHHHPGISFGGVLLRPESRGTVRLRDADVRSSPVIDHRYLGEESDVRGLVAIGKYIERICNTKPLSEWVTGLNIPDPLPVTDEEWCAYARKAATIGYHMVGTCSMGGSDAVVDAELAVRGVPNLRVVDASVMPTIISGNTNAATIMIAEKAADLIHGQRRAKKFRDAPDLGS